MSTPKEVTGDFDKALAGLIANVIAGTKDKRTILHEWDKARGTDWYVGTLSKPIQDWNFPYR